MKLGNYLEEEEAPKGRSTEEVKKLFKAVDDIIDIREAFVWEGYPAGMAGVDQNGDKITFTLRGHSIVEHDGDIAGIRSQIHNLSGKKADIEVDGVKYSASITDSVVTSSRSEPMERDWDAEDDGGDGDYTAIVEGKVTILFSLKV